MAGLVGTKRSIYQKVCFNLNFISFSFKLLLIINIFIILDPHITLHFSFSSRQNFSAILFYASNFRKLNAQVFSRAKIYFSSIVELSKNENDNFKTNLNNNYNNDSSIFSARSIDFNYPIDTKFETGRWIRIPIMPSRIAHSLKIELYFADFAEWILLSEVKFQSGKINF